MFGVFAPKRSFVPIMAALMSYQALHWLMHRLVAVLLHPLTLTLLIALGAIYGRYILRGLVKGLTMCLKWLLRKLFWALVSCCVMTLLWWLVQVWMWCSFQQWSEQAWLQAWLGIFLQPSPSWLLPPSKQSVDVPTCMQNAAQVALSALCGRLFALW